MFGSLEIWGIGKKKGSYVKFWIQIRYVNYIIATNSVWCIQSWNNEAITFLAIYRFDWERSWPREYIFDFAQGNLMQIWNCVENVNATQNFKWTLAISRLQMVAVSDCGEFESSKNVI